MKARDECKPSQVPNTPFGFIEFTMWHGQRALVNLADIQYVCEHTAGVSKDGSRIGVFGDAVYVSDHLLSVILKIKEEQYRQVAGK